jgi:hypothetical protein
MQFVDPNHGSALKKWQDMGSPATPPQAQVAQLIKASELDAPQEHAIGDPITVAGQGLVVLELR